MVSVLRCRVAEAEIRVKRLGVVIDPVIRFIKQRFKPDGKVCCLYNCHSVPDPLRRFEVAVLYDPTDNRFADREYNAHKVKYQLRRIGHSDTVIITMSPTIHADEFNYHVV